VTTSTNLIHANLGREPYRRSTRCLLFCSLFYCAQRAANSPSKDRRRRPEIQVWTGGGYTVPGGTKNTGVWNLGLRYGWVLCRLTGRIPERKVRVRRRAVPMFLIFQPATLRMAWASIIDSSGICTRSSLVRISNSMVERCSQHNVPTATTRGTLRPAVCLACICSDQIQLECRGALHAHLQRRIGQLQSGINTFQVRLGSGSSSRRVADQARFFLRVKVRDVHTLGLKRPSMHPAVLASLPVRRE